jgi:RNA polymerase subunit RPABC4/transcription elongation factor Spt4
MNSLQTFAIRCSYKWRKLQKTPCPICMTEGVSMVPLHMDMRHAICKECRTVVQSTKNECPICRISLSTETFVYDDTDYEDPDYDDDQWYHYD